MPLGHMLVNHFRKFLLKKKKNNFFDSFFNFTKKVSQNEWLMCALRAYINQALFYIGQWEDVGWIKGFMPA